MKTIDWQYDFSTLPCWDNHDKILCVTDEYIESPHASYAFVHNPWTHTRAFDEIIEVDQNTVVIHPHNITVELGKLLYESLDKINNVKTVKFEKKLFGKGRLIPIFD